MHTAPRFSRSSRSFAPWVCAFLTLAASGAGQAQSPGSAAPEALPWGAPVPRTLHRATLTYRQRALDHCAAARMAQRVPQNDAVRSCVDELTASALKASAVARLQR